MIPLEFSFIVDTKPSVTLNREIWKKYLSDQFFLTKCDSVMLYIANSRWLWTMNISIDKHV